jgi:hypothetical protein
MENKKQSSIEWLYIQVVNFPTMDNLKNNIEKLVEEAKQMHEEEIIEANMSARLENSNSILTKNAICKLSQQYYNEQFNQ